MSLFDEAFEHLIGVEGRYSCHPSDPGGATCWGITQVVARANGYTGPMEAMPIEAAKAIYKRKYWDALALDQIGALSEHVAVELFDSGVNCGPTLAGRWLQRSVNCLNRDSAWPELIVDGKPGAKTAEAVAGLLRQRGKEGESVLVATCDGLQTAHYVEITERNKSLRSFFFGWIRNRVRSGLIAWILDRIRSRT